MRIALLALAVASTLSAFAQEPQSGENQEAKYAEVVNQRADKIVAALGLSDTSKAARVRDIISQQYRSLRDNHDARDAHIKAAKEQAGGNNEVAESIVKATQAEANEKLGKLHKEYLAKLSEELTPEQVEKVKDGMTYGVLTVTYHAYLRMLPELTEAQKKQIMAWLVEARENAMDAGSAKEKHAWFGKYKGRINNYLSAAGIDMKKAEKNLREDSTISTPN